MEIFKDKGIEAHSFTSEIVSPKQFLEIQDKNKSVIKTAQFIRPKLGGRHFGKFKVIYKHPIFKPIGKQK